MAIDVASPRSRRALLAAALGAGAATVASAVTRPLPVRAAGSDGSTIHVGDLFADVRSQTTLGNQANDEIVLWVASNGDLGHGGGIAVVGYSAAGLGVHGESGGGQPGVRGKSASSYGVHGFSNSSHGIFGESNGLAGVKGYSSAYIGVYGESQSGFGVRGISGSASAIAGTSGSGTGVQGFSSSSTGVYGSSLYGEGVVGWASSGRSGVLGYSGQGSPPESPPATGVYGVATEGSGSRGVTGRSTAGRGVNGEATTGYGVRGYATAGTAGYFSTQTADSVHTGYALRAIGRVRLDKCAGVATIAANTSSVVVKPGIDLVSTSAVVATLQGSAGATTTTVSRVVVNATTNVFQIHLTTKATQQVKVAWHVFG